MRRALTLAQGLLCALALFAAPPARATLGPPVQITLDRPDGPAEPGKMWKGRFLLTAARDLEVSDLRIDAPLWSSPTLDSPGTAVLAKAGTLDVAFSGVPLSDEAPLTLVLSAGGREVRQTFVLSRKLWDQTVRPAPDRELPASATRTFPKATADEPSPAPTADPALPAGARVRTETITKSAAARSITVRGRILYTRPDGVEVPVDGATVRAYDEDIINWQLGSADVTGTDGRFSISFTWDPCPIVCDQDPDIYIEYEAANGRVHVHPPIGFNFKWRSGTKYNRTSNDVDFGDRTPADESQHNVLFMLSTVTRAWRWLRENESAYDPPDVGVMWLDPTIAGGGYYLLGDIHLGAGRDDDESTVCHEYGHHWVANYGGFNQLPDYCNGICDDGFGLCGHCAYCEENGSTAIQEGFPNWFSEVILRSFNLRYGRAPVGIREFEVNQPCGDIQGDPCACDPLRTEGFFSALLRDLEDGSGNVTDPLQEHPQPYPAAGDELFEGHAPIFQVMDLDEPQSASGFINDYVSRHSSKKSQIWATAKQNTYQIDSANPSNVSGLASSSHTINVASGDHTVEAHWTPATDEMSGIGFYVVTFTQNGPCRPGVNPSGCPGFLGPDTVRALPAPTAISEILPNGNWYVNVLAVDRAGHEASNYRSSGPYVLRAPEPANLTYALHTGWAHEVVPRPTNDATVVNCPDPTALNPAANPTYLNVSGENNGEQTVQESFDTQFLVDGIVRHTAPSLPIPPGGFSGRNLGPITVGSGRHTLEAFFDAQEAVPETSEVDNRIAYQWIWAPSAASAPLTQLRSSPPGMTGGWDAVPGATYFNCDGTRFNTPTADWFVAAAYALDDTTDYDVRVHTASTGPTNGFGSNTGYSSRGAGCTDAVFINRNVATGTAYDIGVLNQNGSTAQYRLSYIKATTFTFGDSMLWAFASNVPLQAHQFTVSATGWVSLDIRHVSGRWPLHLRLYNRTLATGDIDDDLAEVVVDSLERGVISANLTAGEYLALVFRDPKDGLTGATYALEIGPMPPDFKPTVPAGWAAALVPRPAADGTPSSVPLPDTLHGNTSLTYFNLAARNDAFVSSPAWTGSILIDGVLNTTINYAATAAQTTVPFNGTSSKNIRGGRHTLSAELDVPLAVEELFETNNTTGGQWIWSPIPLGFNTAFSRTGPGARTGGWSDMTTGVQWFNADGWRLSAPTTANWAGVMILPGVGCDYDVRLHEASVGATTGFAQNIAYSGWDAEQSDFILVNYTKTSRRSLDAGVLNFGGTGTYYAEGQQSTFLATDPSGTYGPFSILLNHLFKLHEVRLLPGRLYRITLTPTSGAVDWGLSLYRGNTALFDKSAALAASWTAPAGAAETFLVTAPDTGTYCIAAWKAGAADIGVSGNYMLDIVAGNVDSPAEAPPVATRLAAPFPNPAREGAAVAFDLAREADVDLAVYDVQGARVRTLRHGALPAGRHTARWDRLDDTGRPVPTGVYWVRFAAAGTMQARKLVLLR